MNIKDLIDLYSSKISGGDDITIDDISIQSSISKNDRYGGWYGSGEASIEGKNYKLVIRIPNHVIDESNPVNGKLPAAKYTINATSPSINAYGSLSFVATKISSSGESFQDSFYNRLHQFALENNLLSRKKKKLPKTVKSILCITSAGSNIKGDIIAHTGLKDGKVKVFNVGSASKIAEMINNDMYSDIIVLYRGGHEDVAMNMFSEEPVLLAIHNSRVPVCVALGHHDDNPFVYNIADQTFSTPSSFGKSISEHNNGVVYNNNIKRHKRTKYKLIFVIFILLGVVSYLAL